MFNMTHQQIVDERERICGVALSEMAASDRAIEDRRNRSLEELKVKCGSGAGHVFARRPDGIGDWRDMRRACIFCHAREES